eukprot:SAG31_NODE_3526_length_4156_cov_1.726645_5_plen_444_part_00
MLPCKVVSYGFSSHAETDATLAQSDGPNNLRNDNVWIDVPNDASATSGGLSGMPVQPSAYISQFSTSSKALIHALECLQNKIKQMERDRASLVQGFAERDDDASHRLTTLSIQRNELQEKLEKMQGEKREREKAIQAKEEASAAAWERNGVLNAALARANAHAEQLLQQLDKANAEVESLRTQVKTSKAATTAAEARAADFSVRVTETVAECAQKKTECAEQNRELGELRQRLVAMEREAAERDDRHRREVHQLEQSLAAVQQSAEQAHETLRRVLVGSPRKPRRKTQAAGSKRAKARGPLRNAWIPSGPALASEKGNMRNHQHALAQTGRDGRRPRSVGRQSAMTPRSSDGLSTIFSGRSTSATGRPISPTSAGLRMVSPRADSGAGHNAVVGDSSLDGLDTLLQSPGSPGSPAHDAAATSSPNLDTDEKNQMSPRQATRTP